MTTLPNKLAKLLERAGLHGDDERPTTADDCEALMDELSAEISEIRGQLEGERQGLTNYSLQDHTWYPRANHACAMKQALWGALKRHRKTLRALEARQRKAEHAQRAQEQQAAAARRHAERQAAHAARMKTEAEVQLDAIRPLIRNLPEAAREAFYEEMRGAVEEVRAARDEVPA